MQSHTLGHRGELYAQKYLTNKGYSIIATNIRTKSGEIDCLCLVDATLICVEVKTRLSTTMGAPYEAVTSLKRFKIMQTLYTYLHTHTIQYSAVQIDILSLIVNPNGTIHSLKHFKNDLL